MHILDVLVLLGFFFQTFYSVFLSGFIRNNWKFHMFFNCEFASDEWANTIGMPVFLETSDDVGHLEDAN